jgi:hypothetical protein
MHEFILKPGWETLLVAVPFVLLLFVGMFRLDELFTSRKQLDTPQARPLCGVDEDGAPILCDPDGRPWRKPRLSK